MRKLVAALIASAPFLAVQPAIALEPWHDNYTAKAVKEKLAQAGRTAGAVDARIGARGPAGASGAETPSPDPKPNCLIEELKRTEGYMPSPVCVSGSAPPKGARGPTGAAGAETPSPDPKPDCLIEQLKWAEGYVPSAACVTGSAR